MTPRHPPKAASRVTSQSQVILGLKWVKREKPSEWYLTLPIGELTIRFREGAWNGRISNGPVIVRRRSFELAAEELIKKIAHRLLQTLRVIPNLGELLQTTKR